MRLSHTLGRTSVAFDDPNLVSPGGLFRCWRWPSPLGCGTWPMGISRCRPTRARNPGLKVASLAPSVTQPAPKTITRPSACPSVDRG